MGRLQRTAGGDSQLGYLFGTSIAQEVAPQRRRHQESEQESAQSKGGTSQEQAQVVASTTPVINASIPPVAALTEANVNIRTSMDCIGEASKEDAATLAARKGFLGRSSNNYERSGGQNNDNFITDRPSTKVHAIPGGNSQLGYLFGGH